MADLIRAFAPLGGTDPAAATVEVVDPIVPASAPPADDLLARNRHQRMPDYVWHYTDASGSRYLLSVCRWTLSDGGKDIRQLTPRAGGWIWKGHPDPRPLYGLDLLAARPVATAVVVEGEKTADAARLLLPGHVVITWPGGAQGVGKADWRPLAGRAVALWPDSDEPGREAMRQVRDRLAGIAASVAEVDLEAVRVALGGILPVAWDLADWPDTQPAEVVHRLVHDAPAVERPAAALSAINALVEHHLGKPTEECDPLHGAIVAGIIDKMARQAVVVDAQGAFRRADTWGRVAFDLPALARDLAFDLRRDGERVDTGRVLETAETMAGRDAQHRRAELYQTMLGKPSNPAGMVELRRWVRAVTGTEREADLAVMAHFLWLAKTRAAGRPGERHLMPVLVGARQGTGKSVSVAKLCSPWQELFDPDITLETITDERSAPHLARTVLGLWDELGGLGRADMERLKHRLTAPTIGYRPMRSNQRVELPMLCTFIGTSNKPLADLVRDTSGMRRFYEVQAAEVIDWDAINAIDYAVLWQAVAEDESAPGVVHRAIIEAAQAPLVWKDPVQRWLEDEDDGGWSMLQGIDGQGIPAIIPAAGAASAILYERFRCWCATAGERELTREIMGRRLGELGWVLFRLPRGQGQAKAYRRPVIEVGAGGTVHTHAQTGGREEVCTAVHGATGDFLYDGPAGEGVV